MKPGTGRAYLFWVALLVVAAPASAQFPSGDELNAILFGEGKDGEIFRYQIGDITNSSDNGFSDQFNFIKLHTKPLGPTAPVLRIGVVATYTVQQSNDGEWLYELHVDDKPIEDCAWHLQTLDPGGFLAGDLVTYPQFQVSCTVGPDVTATFTESQLVNISVTRTVLSGLPDQPTAASTNIVIERADFVVNDVDVNISNLEHWLPVLFFMALMLWSLWNGWKLPGLAGLLGVASVYIPLPFSEAAAVFLFMLTIWLHFYIERRRDHMKL